MSMKLIFNIKKIIGEREIELKIPHGTTVAQLISIMISRWGDELADSLLERSSGQLNPKISLMVNGRGIGLLNKMETVLRDGDHFLILPPNIIFYQLIH